MIPWVLTLLSLIPHPRVGIAKYYSPGVFAMVAHNRHMAMDPSVYGYASTPDCRWLGSTIWASINHRPPRSYQVLDCSQPRDYPRHVAEGLIIEINYSAARDHGFLDEPSAPATVYFPKGDQNARER